MTCGRRPNFLIVGAAKAGTTSLFAWLSQHPEVFMPGNKEPTFFVEGTGASSYSAYLALFESTVAHKAIGEASAAYLAAPESPGLIRDALGDVKILIILRNPAHRAFSLHSWMTMEGYEYLSFERALEAESQRCVDKGFRERCPQYFYDYLYFRTGLYHQQVIRYFETFGRERIKVMLFEDLLRSPQVVFKEVCAFLGIDPTFTPSFDIHNRSIHPRSILLQYCFRALRRRLTTEGSNVAAAIGVRGFSRLMTWNLKLGMRPILRKETEAKLAMMYKADLLSLSSLIERDLSAWYAGVDG